MTTDEIKKVEKIVNQKIKEDLPVSYQEMSLEQARKEGAIGLFGEKYGDLVKVYSIGEPQAGLGKVFSREICGGPHTAHTGLLGNFKITKEQASSAGVRRIKAVLKNGSNEPNIAQNKN